MSVYNDASSIRSTVESITSQQGVTFEFIIVNDGSTDESLSVLQALKEQDSRVVLINQTNQGLTNALIAGCSKARGKYIARQDNGDTSLTGRLKKQFEYLSNNPNVSMLSCSTRFVTPDGEELYCVTQEPLEALQGLKQVKVNSFYGPPHHGSVMFNREAYEQSGGYRSEFKVAQDIDLWTRLVELGEHHSLKGVFYQAGVEMNSISILKRNQQLEATQVVIECAQARKNTGDDANVLLRYASKASKPNQQRYSSETEAAYYYFLGSNLLKSNPAASIKYLRLAIKRHPWHWKARFKLTISLLQNLSNVILK